MRHTSRYCLSRNGLLSCKTYITVFIFANVVCLTTWLFLPLSSLHNVCAKLETGWMYKMRIYYIYVHFCITTVIQYAVHLISLLVECRSTIDRSVLNLFVK